MPHDFYVTVVDERAEAFRRVFGSSTIPVLLPAPVMANLPGMPMRRVFLLAVKELTAEQRERLVTYLAAKFEDTRESVEHELDVVGMPVIAHGCVATVISPQKWV